MTRAAPGGTGRRGGRSGPGAAGCRSHALAAVAEALTAASPVVLTTHANLDGDAAGSVVALASFLDARGAEARIAAPTPFPDAYRFLLPDPALVLPHRSAAEADWCRRAGLAVVADTGDQRRIGRIARMIRGLPTVVIDHHPAAQRPVEGTALIDTGAAAAGELVFEVIDHAGGPWSRTIADALYVAILTDTGGFRFPNTTPRSLRIAARLVEMGADPESLHRAAYSRHHPRRYALMREALDTLTVHAGGRIAWIVVPKDAFDSLGATVDDIEGFVDLPRDLAGVDVAILFRTTRDDRIKVSLRATGAGAVDRVALALGGGGHRSAAAAVVSGPLTAAVDRVVAMVAASLHG